jgi:hypothetical protein
MPTLANNHIAAQCKFTSNGDNAKTVKVQIVARSGDPVDSPWFGPMVHDFAGMTNKARIPIDYAHDQYDNIGYLNHFDTSTGDLICTGAIVKTDPSCGSFIDDLIVKMETGVPYEASIQFDDDYTIEFVPEGVQVTINNRTIMGPVTVVRQWSLIAVAICKFGMDSNTSAELQMSKTESKSINGFFAHITKSKSENKMEKLQLGKQEQAVATAVEAKVEIEKPIVEAEVKAEVQQLSDKPAEIAPAIVDAVTMEKAEAKEVTEMTKPVAVEAPAVESKAVMADPREEFKRFVTEFGAEKAAYYFASGKSFSEAQTMFVGDIKSENEQLKKLLASSRGAEKPVAFSDSIKRDEAAKPKGMEAVIKRVPVSKKTK